MRFRIINKLLFLLMLFSGLFLTFGSIAVALGVMQLGEEQQN